mgnify:CR=1 FL=1
MTEITENLLSEINDGLRTDVERVIGKLFKTNYHSNRDIDYHVSITCCDSRFNFSIWLTTKQNEKQIVFNEIKNHLEKTYGFNLVNQRLYTYRISMEFDGTKNKIDVMQIYTLLKIYNII